MALSQLAFDVGKSFPSSWDLDMSVLDGFEKFMETTPNLDPAPLLDQQEPAVHAVGTSQSSDTPEQHQSHGSKTSKLSEKRQQSNRAAQKRYRERRKVRSQTTAAQLAETQGELQELRIRQQQLEARNLLLEKAAKLKEQATSETDQSVLSPQAIGQLWGSIQADAEVALKGMTKESKQGRIITFTVGPAPKYLTVEEVGQISPADFRRVYSLYARKLGACLLECCGAVPCSAADDMQRWIRELSSMMICVSLSNPKGLREFQTASMDCSQTSASVQDLPDSFYEDLLAVMELTEAQIQDLLHLRRLFCGRLGQLGRSRKQLLSRLPSETMGVCHASDKLEELTHIAEQLNVNGKEEYRSYMQFSSTFYRGILTARQKAIAVVHSYPWLPEKHRLLEHLAGQRDEPKAADLSQNFSFDDLQLAANWQQVEEYLKTVTMDNVHDYIPLEHSVCPAS